MNRLIYCSALLLFSLVFSLSAHAAPAENTCTRNMEASAFWRINETADGWAPRGETLAENTSSFLEESNLTLELRNVWENARINNSGTPQTQYVEWAQTGTLRFSSGMLYGMLGVDAVWFGVTPLREESDHTDSKYSTSTFFKDDDERFRKGGISLKLSPFKGMLLKAGRMESPHILLGPGDYRTTPRLYELGMARYTRGPLTFSFIRANKISDYTQDSFHDFALNRGNWRNKDLKDEPVNVGDFLYRDENLMLNAAYARQEDYGNYLFVESQVTWPAFYGVTFRTDINFRQKESELKDHKELDNSLSLWAGRIVTDYKQARLTVAYSAVENNTEFGQSIDGTMGADWVSDGTILAGCKDAGLYTNGVQGLFSHQGENSFKIEPEYRFEGFLKGLTLSVYYIKGWDIYDGSDYATNQRQKEYGGHLRYNPDFLKGLAIHAQYGKNNMETDKDEWGWKMDQTMQRVQVDVKYTVALF